MDGIAFILVLWFIWALASIGGDDK